MLNSKINDRVIRLLLRTNGADMHELQRVGFKRPSIAALHIAERRGLSTSIAKMKGRMTRYYARKPVSRKRSK